MLTFLFWNLGGKPLQSRIARLASAHQVDVVILAECLVPADEIRQELNQGLAPRDPGRFFPPNPYSLCERIVILARFTRRFIELRAESPHYTARSFRLPGIAPFLLMTCHLPSKLYRSEDSQLLAVTQFGDTIRRMERDEGHSRTVLVGDLNMNPFEAGVVGAEGLNAVMTREIAKREGRTVDGQWYPFFYNPMWGCFGDASHEEHPPGSGDHKPSGTCYYPAAESKWYYWNLFDQVLLRPSLLECFKHRDLRILTGDGVDTILNPSGLPDRMKYSDHLPLLFRLRM